MELFIEDLVPPVGGGPAIVELISKAAPSAPLSNTRFTKQYLLDLATGKMKPLTLSVSGKPAGWVDMSKLRLRWYAVGKDQKSVCLSVEDKKKGICAILTAKSTAGPWNVIYEQNKWFVFPRPAIASDGSFWYARPVYHSAPKATTQRQIAMELVRYDPAACAEKVVFRGMYICGIAGDAPGGNGVDLHSFAN